ncbi:MAG TPA: lactonase family protein [Pirellulales bacterium]|nr:lactonase family protein [Pirellulales bacterium]
MHRFALVLAGWIVAASLNWVAAADAEPRPSTTPDSWIVYVGTYTGEKSQGIYACRLDLASGKCSQPVLAAKATNPSSLAAHPSGRFLYSVGEIDDRDDKPIGEINGFAIDRATLELSPLNHRPSGGEGPCYLAVDKSGGCLLVANYGGGVASFPLDSQGRLGAAASVIQHKGHSVNPKRQEASHAHSINLDRGNRFAVAADLGLDKVLVYRLDPATARLTANDPPSVSVAPGSGPRHFAFHPSGKFGYVINEMACTITAFDYDASAGRLTPIETISSLREGEPLRKNYSAAEIQVHPSGKFVYASNRGLNSITLFAVDGVRGTLRSIDSTSTRGKTPYGFGIDPTGNFLLAGNQDSNTVVTFRIDQQTGRLAAVGEPQAIGSPVCFEFVAP